MSYLKVFALFIFLFCSACATSETKMPMYSGEATEDCDYDDVPLIKIRLSSATDNLNMNMRGWTLDSAIGTHQFSDIKLCQNNSPKSCVSVTGVFELQKLSFKEATGRIKFTSVPLGTWQPFVLKAKQLKVICG